MDRRGLMEAARNRRRLCQLRDSGVQALSLVLSAALVFALVPVQAVPALADELAPSSEEELGVTQIVDDETPLTAPEQDETPASEDTSEEEAEQVTAPDSEEAPDSEVEQAPLVTMSAKKAPPLKAPPATPAAVSVTYGPETPIDGVYQRRTIELTVTPVGEGVTLVPGASPTATVTYTDSEYEDHDTDFNSLSTWTVAPDGLSATCALMVGQTGSYFKGTLKGVQTSAGTVDVAFGLSNFEIVAMPIATKVWLQDSSDNWIVEDGTTQRLNVIKALKDPAVEKPIVRDGKTVVVRVRGALDTKETIETFTVTESNSYVELLGEGGKQIAVATLKRVSEGTYEATFTRRGDNEVKPEYMTPDNHGPLPEGPIGIKIVALDQFGTKLTSTIDGATYDYGLIAADLKNTGGTVVPKADGRLILDGGAPLISFATDGGSTLDYPHDKAVIKAGETVEGLPAEAAKTDFFDRNVTIEASVTDNNLDMTASTFDGLTFEQIQAAGNDGLTVGGVTYKVRATFDGTGVGVLATYADGVHALPKIVAKDYLNVTTYDPATELGGAVEQFVVDSMVPEVTGAAVGATPASQAVDANNRVYFFKTGESAPLTVRVIEKGGIKSVVLTADGYALGSGVASKIEELNHKLVETDFDGVYELQIIDKLLNERELSDSMALTITDFAGNVRVWSLAEKGMQQAHADGATAEVGNADAFYEAIGATPFNHPTILIEDDIKPVVTLTGPADRTDPVAPGYNRIFSGSQDVSLKIVEFNMRYLRNFMAGTEGDTNVDSSFVGLDPDRQVMTVTHWAPDGTNTVRTITAADLTFSENTVYTWSDTLLEDGTYQVSAKVIDAAGNESAEQTIADFTIDATAPVITVDWDPLDSSAIDGKYFNAKRTADITVAEANFDRTLFDIQVLGKDTPSTYSAFVYDPAAWIDNHDGTYTYHLDFDNDGRYSVAVTGQDKAGNDAEYDGDSMGYATDWFVIDTEAPVIARYVTSEDSYDASTPVIEMPTPAHIHDGVSYYAGPVELDAQVKDRNLDTVTTTLNGTATTWTDPDPDADGYRTHGLQKKLSFTADGEYQTPQIAAADLAGNTSDNGVNVKSFVVDLEAPTVSVSADRGPSAQGNQDSGDPYNFYNQTTTLTITVSDGHALYSIEVTDPDGTYNPSWGPNPLGAKQSTASITLQDNATTPGAEFERNIILTATDIAGNVRTWSIDHNDTVTQTMGPSAANASINGSGEHPEMLILDKVAPVVGLSGVTAGSYYNTPQSVVASVNEYNLGYLQMFDGGRGIVTVTKYEGNAGRAASSWGISASSFGGSRPNYSYTQGFDSDGHYVVTAQFEDFAGNLSNEAAIGEFTIDMTPPQLSMSFDNNDVRNEMYYKATRTATISVVEHNFDPSLINIQTEGAIGGWDNNGDTHTCEVFFGEGGPYTITVNGEDMAGNKATEVTEPSFIVDLTAPEVTIAGMAQRLGYVGESGQVTNAYHDKLEDKSAYNGVVVPAITYTDNEVLSAADLAYSVTGSKHGENVGLEGAMPEESKEMTVSFRDVGYQGPDAGDGSNWEDFYVDDYAVDADDIYTLKATMTDQAGNEAEAELVFSVNRYGSNFEVEMQGVNADELEEYERSGMLSEAPTIVVREINVSGVAQDSDHHVEKEFANATTAIRLQDGKGLGYALSVTDPQQAPNGWSEYVYTVRSANFGEGSDSDNNDRGQGVYRVNVMSDDTSSNANTTAEYWRSDDRRAEVTADGATAEFILDELPPAIDEVDLPEGISAGATYEASFHVTDDITSGNTIEVQVDGQTLSASEVSGPRSGVGTFSFTVPAKAFNWHRSIKIMVRDYAGREATASNSGWVWQSTFIPESMAAVAVAAAAVAGTVIHRRRKAAAEPDLPA